MDSVIFLCCLLTNLPAFWFVLGLAENVMASVLKMDHGSVSRRHVDQIHYPAPFNTVNADISLSFTPADPGLDATVYRR